MIIGSTRPTRICPGIAAWTRDALGEQSPLSYELIDLAEGRPAVARRTPVLGGLHMRPLPTRLELIITDNDLDDEWQLTDLDEVMQSYHRNCIRSTPTYSKHLATTRADSRSLNGRITAAVVRRCRPSRACCAVA
ncbi:MAG: hypothetical protein WAL22_17925 [Solirubrobacteraceae bacterium]